MSSDNGTYILQTYGPEFRVMHCFAIDNIYGTWVEESLTYAPNAEAIVDYFKEAKVFTDIEQAWDYALALEEEMEYSEYGACLISDFAAYAFTDLQEKADGKKSRN
jgi:hypothetical protein